MRKRIEVCLGGWLAAALLSIPMLGHSEPKEWMERDGARYLGLWVTAEGCPFTESDIRPVVEDEFDRARITPTRDSQFNLTVGVTCVPIVVEERTLGYAIAFDIRYGTGIYLYEFPNYGSLISAGDDTSGGDHFKASFEGGIRSALADYRRVNFGG